MNYLFNVFWCPGGKRLPCGPLQGSSLLRTVNADFNEGAKVEEATAESLAKDDSSRFRVAQSSLRD